MSQMVQISLPPYLPTGQIMPIEVAGKSLALARVGSTWHVFENSCPHAGCSFSGSGGIYKGILSCDCHGAEFDLKTGAVLQGPTREPVTIFAVQLNETTLDIFLPE